MFEFIPFTSDPNNPNNPLNPSINLSDAGFTIDEEYDGDDEESDTVEATDDNHSKRRLNVNCIPQYVPRAEHLRRVQPNPNYSNFHRQLSQLWHIGRPDINSTPLRKLPYRSQQDEYYNQIM